MEKIQILSTLTNALAPLLANPETPVMIETELQLVTNLLHVKQSLAQNSMIWAEDGVLIRWCLSLINTIPVPTSPFNSYVELISHR